VRPRSTSAINSKLPPRGLISIGTNSTRLLILEGDAVATAQSLGTRLGRGLDAGGKLDPQARELTLETIRAYMADVRARRAPVDVIATSALRRADDAAQFVGAVQAITGVAARIISGDEEAAYSFAGATWGARATGRVGVLDVGGGSTELAVGTRAAIERTISLEIGAVRLSEKFPALLGETALDRDAGSALVARARAACDAILAPLGGFEPFDELLAVGGTVFTAAAMLSGDPLLDGVRIDRVQRRAIVDDLLARDLPSRRSMANIRPQRADILPAGLIIVDAACERLRIDALRVSHADLLAGYLRSPEYRGVAAPAARF
jgi:exopolyphosphatase/guanosine-5'-triphosphate,3'-diphosphate pyrophosphatase